MSNEKPSITIPQTDAPTELVATDIVVGTGDEATKGRNVSVHYVGVAWSNGRQFDAVQDK
jgi:peptidylprolyl isomerase